MKRRTCLSFPWYVAYITKNANSQFPRTVFPNPYTFIFFRLVAKRNKYDKHSSIRCSKDAFPFFRRYTLLSDYINRGNAIKPGEYWTFIIHYLKERNMCFPMEANDVKSQVLSKAYKEMQQRYVGFDDPAHGWDACRASL